MWGFDCAHRWSKTNGRRWAKPERVVLLMLFLGTLFRAQQTASRFAGIDYYQFWVGGRAAASHQGNDLYTQKGRVRLGQLGLTEALASRDPKRVFASRYRTVLETYSTPFLYATFRAFSTDDYRRDLSIFRYVSLGAFVVATTLFARMLSLGWTAVVATLTLLLSGFEPLASELRVGNVNCLQFFGLAVVTYVLQNARYRYRAVLAGCVFGLLVAFKPNLALVTPFLLVEPLRHRKYRPIIELFLGIIVSGLLAVVTSSVVFGSLHCWTDFLTSLRAMPNDIIRAKQGNLALLVVFERFLPISGAAFSTFAALIALLPLALAIRAKPVDAEEPSTKERAYFSLAPLALGCLFLLLVPRLAWLHYFVLAVPAMLLTLTTPSETRTLTQPRLLFAAFIWFGLGLNPLSLFGIYYNTQQHGLWFASVSLALLFVTYVRVLVRYQRAPLRIETLPLRT